MLTRRTAVTRQQQAVYFAILDHMAKSGGQSPTLREIMVPTDIHTEAQVTRLLDGLDKAGYLRRDRGPRGIVLFQPGQPHDCPDCDAALYPTNRFCPNCGHRLDTRAAA